MKILGGGEGGKLPFVRNDNFFIILNWNSNKDVTCKMSSKLDNRYFMGEGRGRAVFKYF